MTFSRFKILPTMYYFSTKASKSIIDIKASKSIIDIKASKSIIDIKASKSTIDIKASKSTIDIKASKSIIDIIQVNTLPNSTIIQNQYFKSSNDYITNESVVTGIYYP